MRRRMSKLMMVPLSLVCLRHTGPTARARPIIGLSVSNSSSGRRWKLDHAPAVGDPTQMVEFGTGRRAFAREA